MDCEIWHVNNPLNHTMNWQKKFETVFIQKEYFFKFFCLKTAFNIQLMELKGLNKWGLFVPTLFETL